MSEIVSIIMHRDHVNLKEAVEMYNHCKAEITDALMGTNCLDPEEILKRELRLDPEFMFYFL